MGISMATADTANVQQRVDWVVVLNVVLAGIAAAMHVGKTTIALPSLQQEFGGSLASLSWIMSVFPLIGVFGGIAAGMLVRHWGERRLLIAGLGILGISSIVGALTHSFEWLLVSRFIEGLGFLTVVVAAPSVLNRTTPIARRPIVFGLWSTFMGAGIALSMLIGPTLGNWRNDWFVSAALVLITAAGLLLTTPADAVVSRQATTPVWSQLRSVMGARATLTLALSFTAYNLQFFAVMTFLPVFLMQRLGVPVGTAGVIGAAIVAANIVGNLAAGLLLSRGIRAGTLIAVSAVLVGVAGVCIFYPQTPASVAVVLCFVFSAIAGVLPATILATASSTAPSPSLAPLSIGWVMQGNYLGQVIGPVLIGTIVGALGWSGAMFLMMFAAMMGVGLGMLLLCTSGRAG